MCRFQKLKILFVWVFYKVSIAGGARLLLEAANSPSLITKEIVRL
jgi:hypothetical protein